jgi:hypothetical protein
MKLNMFNGKGKGKGKVHLEQASKAQKGSRYIALLFFNLSTRWGWVVNATPRPLYRRERHGTHFGTTYLMNYLN